MKKIPFIGSGVAIITPYNGYETDYEAFGRLIDFQIQNGTDAIVVCGTTGESATMPDKEHLEVIRFAIRHTNGRVPVIAGTGSNDTRHGIELSKEAEHMGASALLLVTPYYNKTTQTGLVNHFSATADAVNIPVILYNVPPRTGMTISIDTYCELAKVPNIVATKEASADFSLASEIAARCGDELHMYSGNDDIILPMLSLGSKGVISVFANICPQETHDICQYFFDGNIEKSREIQLSMLRLINALFMEVNPIPVKTALNLMGFEVGNLRLPLCEMEGKNLEKLKNILGEYGLTK